MNNPFDLDALDIKVSNAENFAEAEPQTTAACVIVSLMSKLCCVVTVTLLACTRLSEEQ
jgi:hypothetical protein